VFVAPFQNNQMIQNPQLQESLNDIKKAVQGEREDELFYDYLISVAPTREEREIIASIRDDERRHNQIFRRIYKDFTGMDVVSMDEEKAFEKPDSYLDGIKKALFGELAAVERYRNIRRALHMGPYRDMLFDIITDELKHASKYNYLFTLNSTMNNSEMNKASMTNSSMKRLERIAYKFKFTPDDWIRYITPLVNRALEESKAGINPEHLYQEFILAGLLVGLGMSPEDAIDQVEEWEDTGASKLLAKSKISRYFD
jgi:rubrerythrin